MPNYIKVDLNKQGTFPYFTYKPLFFSYLNFIQNKEEHFTLTVFRVPKQPSELKFSYKFIKTFESSNFKVFLVQRNL